MRFMPILYILMLCGLVSAQQGPSPLIGKIIHVYNPIPGESLYVDLSGAGYHIAPTAGTNWLTYTVPSGIQDHINNFGIRSSYSRQPSVWMTRTGLGSGGANLFTMADFAGGNEVWIIIDPAGPSTGKTHVLTQAPKQVHVLNPWRLTAPVLVYSGGRKTMLTVSDRCGWFMAYLLETAESQFHFAEVTNAGTYGRAGLGSTQAFDLTTEFASKGPTLWLDTQLNTWYAAWPNKDDAGGCRYQMAAVVRDFAVEHEDFDPSGTGNIGGKGMVKVDLGPDNKPVRSDLPAPNTTRFTDWFNTTPASVTGVNKNYETCVDLPMSKTNDGMWEYDSESGGSPGYFPIEDFANPNNQRNPACNGPTRNWTSVGTRNLNFCMEAHAKFRYRKGQTFSFRGDDDVWVFINKKLVIDLGGIHVPQSDSVLLDTLGRGAGTPLVEGQEYAWDFFFCERKACGSSLRIKTSIFFEQVKALEAKEVAGKPGTFEIIKREGGTGACGSAGGEVKEVPVDPAKIVYKLRSSTATTDLESLGEGSFHNGGIVIATPNITVDTSKITALPPGNYRVVAFEVATPTIVAEVPFVISNRSWVQFVPKEATVMVGTRIPVVAANQIGSAAPTGVMGYTFTVTPPTGLQVFGDSAGTVPVTNSGTTGADGLDTLWVGVNADIDASVTFTLNTAGSTRAVKVTFTPRPLDLPVVTKATIYDQDANGVADRIVAVYDRDISALLPNLVAFQWPASAAQVQIQGTSLTGTVAGTTMTLAIKPLDTSTVLTDGTGSFHSRYPARGGRDSTQTVPLADGIAPVLLSAVMLGDTLRLTFSEPVNITGLAAPADLFVYRLNQTGTDLRFAPIEIRWNAARDGADLIFTAGSSEAPRSGNLVRIMDGAGRIADAAGNGAGPNSRFRLITGTKKADVATVTYIKVDKALVETNPAPLATTLEGTNAKVEDVVARTGRLGHLIKVDLGDHAQADDFTPMDPSQVFLEYQVGYFTNHGQPIASEKRTISCQDQEIFKGDCRSNRGYLFVGWNYNTLKAQRVGTGAYIARIRYKVVAAGKTPVSGDLDQVWGVLRTY